MWTPFHCVTAIFMVFLYCENLIKKGRKLCHCLSMKQGSLSLIF